MSVPPEAVTTADLPIDPNARPLLAVDLAGHRDELIAPPCPRATDRRSAVKA